MKKAYKAPLTEVVKIHTEQMICESINEVAGLTGVKRGGGDFGGGSSDSKDWDDYDEDLW